MIFNNAVRFGWTTVFPDTPFKGQLDEVEIYNRALSASEINNIYTAGGGTTPTPTPTPSPQPQPPPVVTLPPPPVGKPPPVTTGSMTLLAGQQLLTEVVVDERIRLPVYLYRPNNVASLNFDLGYDPSVVRIEGEVVRNLESAGLLSVNTNIPGKISVGFARSDGLSGGDRLTMIEVPFRAVGKPGDQTLLTLSVSAVQDPDGNNITYGLGEGRISVVKQDELPRGDCNNNTYLDASDASCVLEISVGLKPFNKLFDMNGDNLVNSRDAVLILQEVTKRLQG
jgi:hypothetical protein